MAKTQFLDSLNQVITHNNYTGLQPGQQLDVFNQLIATTFKTVVFDTLKGLKAKGYDHFVVAPVYFGKGYREITAGINAVDTFTTDPQMRVPQFRNIVKDFVIEITDRVQLFQMLTINEAEYIEAFKSNDNIMSYFGLVRQRLSDSMTLAYQDMVQRFFYGSNWKFKNLNANTAQAVGNLIDKTREKFKRVVKLKIAQDSYIDKAGALLNFISTVTTIASDRFNCGVATPDSIPDKVLNAPRREDLLLIISSSDINDFKTQTRSGLFNPEDVNFPPVDTLELPLPKGKMYLVEKRFFQIAPNKNLITSQFFGTTLDTDIYYHEWFYMGINPKMFGTEIQFTTDNTGLTYDQLLAEVGKVEGFVPDAAGASEKLSKKQLKALAKEMEEQEKVGE